MLIDRYIAKQILICSAVATATLSIVLVLGNVLKEVFDLLVNHRVPFLAILDFVACAVPFCVALALPWGFLTAVFLVFGRMAADNELFAICISGVSIGRVCRSVFIIAVAFCLLCFWINAEINPRARRRMKSILHTLAISTLLNDSASSRIFSLAHKKIYVGSQDAGYLQNIQIYEFNEASELDKVLFARRGWLESEEDKDELVIHLEDVTTDDRDPVNGASVPSFPPGTTVRNSQPDRAERVIHLRDVTNDDRELVNETNVPSFHRGMAVHEYAYGLSFFELLNHYSSDNYRSLGSYTLWGLRDELKKGTSRTVFLTEFNKRIALSLACLAFVLTGVPLAIMCHRKETTAGFGLGLAIACLYYAFVVIADGVRDNPRVHPELLTWASNCLFTPIGVMLFWRLSKH